MLCVSAVGVLCGCECCQVVSLCLGVCAWEGVVVGKVYHCGVLWCVCAVMCGSWGCALGLHV